MYMSVEFIKKNGFSIKPDKLSDTSRTLINKIVNQILLGQDSWKTNQTYREYRLGQDEFPKDVDFYHIVDEIRTEIEMFSKIGKKYSFIIGSRTFTIFAIYPYNPSMRISPTNIYKMLDENVIKMYIWLYVATQFIQGSECSPQLTIYLYLTDHKKKIPKKSGEPLSEIHANTGFTMACPTVSNNIYIYRREEWFKVFIHETFHSLGLDFARMPEEIANREIFKMFSISCDLRFYEAYTETWAEIIHAIFVSMTPPSRVLESALNDERMFSLFQKTKLLKHHKMDYRELCSVSSQKRYNEKTAVFSYYFLKSIMMFYYNEFIEWCVENNGGTFAFKKTPANIISLTRFIKSHYNRQDYKENIENFEKWFSKNSHKDMIEMKSLKMSVSTME